MYIVRTGRDWLKSKNMGCRFLRLKLLFNEWNVTLLYDKLKGELIDYPEILWFKKSFKNNNNIMNAQFMNWNTPMLDAISFCAIKQNRYFNYYEWELILILSFPFTFRMIESEEHTIGNWWNFWNWKLFAFFLDISIILSYT